MADGENLEQLLQSRLRSANDLNDQLQGPNYCDLAGVKKLRTRLASEITFLNGVANGKPPLEKKYIETSNVTHFENIVKAMDRYENIKSVCHSVAIMDRETSETMKHTVDLVVDNGLRWIKIISRSCRGMAMDWMTGNARHIFEQADSYLKMARLFKRNLAPPTVVFDFIAGVPDRMADRLRYLGVTVVGEEVPMDTVVKLTPDYKEIMEEWEKEKEERGGEGGSSEDPSGPNFSVNLDVSAVFVLVSNLTHPRGTEHRFDSKLLKQQLEMEKKSPAREKLLREIEGHPWIICRTAYDSVCSIVKTVAGPTEKERVEELWKQVVIVDDDMSERTEDLDPSDRINDRSRMIFGTGDKYCAVTATANKHFVSSAYHQGICFDVIAHESRALSEQKELPLE